MYTIRKSLIVLAFLSLFNISCKKLSDYNVNPNATTTAPYYALLTNVESGLGGYGFQATPGYYCQYFSQTQYTTEENYSTPTYNFSGTYSSYLEDMQNIIDNSANNNMIQVARIIKDYIFWTITDMVGDIPYTAALKGGNGNNAYDKQETVYKGLIDDLTSAAASFDQSSIISGDIIFARDAGMWIKTANSMRMLMALRLSKVYPGNSDYAATEFKSAMNATGGIITDNADNFKIVYPGTVGFKNPIYNGYDGRKDNAECKTMTDLLSNLKDGRQNAYGGISEIAGTTTSSDVGFPTGLTQAEATAFINANSDWARVLRGDLRQASSAIYLITAAQINLAIAEAIDRGWVSGTLSTYYQAGVNASFEQWGLTLPDASYFTQSDIALTGSGSAANIKQIAIQRYIATYPDGLQGWNEWRRTGYPELTPSVNATNSSKLIPRRFTYGTTEYATNGTNTKAAAAAIGGDTPDTRVWWDKE